LDRRRTAVAVIAGTAISFVSALAALPSLSLDNCKAVLSLSASARTTQRDHEIRLASFQYTQPSLVFYNQREVKLLMSEDEVARFLAHPLPAFLFMPEPAWAELRQRRPELQAVIAARHWDFYRRCEILVLRNAAAEPTQLAETDQDGHAR
jgi:hypothetical protein